MCVGSNQEKGCEQKRKWTERKVQCGDKDIRTARQVPSPGEKSVVDRTMTIRLPKR